jgi:hypothetical protein
VKKRTGGRGKGKLVGSNEPWSSIKDTEFLHYLSDYWLLNTDSVPWNSKVEKVTTAPPLRQLVAGFPPRRPGFKPGSGHVGICDGQKWRWGRFSPSTSVSPANLHSICFSTIIFTTTRGWHNRPGVAAVQIALQKKKKMVEKVDHGSFNSVTSLNITTALCSKLRFSLRYLKRICHNTRIAYKLGSFTFLI